MGEEDWPAKWRLTGAILALAIVCGLAFFMGVVLREDKEGIRIILADQKTKKDLVIPLGAKFIPLEGNEDR